MSARVIDGRVYAAELARATAREVTGLAERGVRTSLATLRLGTDDGALLYEKRLRRLADEVGCHHVRVTLPADASQADAVAAVERLSVDPRISAVLLLRPMPAQVVETLLHEAIDPLKDIEAMHPENAGLLLQGRPRYLPATAAAVFHLLDRYLARSGREPARTYPRANLVVVGRSDNVGRPVELLAQARNATTVSCDVHSHRAGLLSEHTRRADILVVAAGVPGLIRAEHVKAGAVVVDVGINVVHDRDDGAARVVGDVHPGVHSRASAITPVPGGVGPVTDACLLRNAVRAARAQHARADATTDAVWAITR